MHRTSLCPEPTPVAQNDSLFQRTPTKSAKDCCRELLGNQKLFYIMYILSDKVNPIIYHTILHVVLKDFSGVADLDPFCCKANPNPLLYQQQDNKSLGSRFHCAHLSSRIQR